MPEERPYYYQVERGVMSLLNGLKSDVVVTAEASFTATILTPDSVARNAMFPPAFVRHEILNVERLIAGQICLTEGHPRRADFVTAQEMKHGDPLPSSFGGIGAVYEGEGKNAKYYVNRPIDVVEANRPNGEIIGVGALNPRAERLWGWDGATFFASTDNKLFVELFGMNLPAYNAFADLAVLFSVTTPVETQLHAEFQMAWESATAAVLAAKVGTFPREASDYWNKFLALMAAQRTPIKVDLDFASRGAE